MFLASCASPYRTTTMQTHHNMGDVVVNSFSEMIVSHFYRYLFYSTPFLIQTGFSSSIVWECRMGEGEGLQVGMCTLKYLGVKLHFFLFCSLSSENGVIPVLLLSNHSLLLS